MLCYIQVKWLAFHYLNMVWRFAYEWFFFCILYIKCNVFILNVMGVFLNIIICNTFLGLYKLLILNFDIHIKVEIYLFKNFPDSKNIFFIYSYISGSL